MKRIEITHRAEMNELDKLMKQLEKREAALLKKKAKAEKYGVAEMTADEHREWLSGVEKTEGIWIKNKEDIAKNEAWFDLHIAQKDVEETKGRIERAEARLAKAEKEVEAYHEEVARVQGLKAKEELMKIEFEQEQKEWLKDGITLEGRYFGVTKQGKRFSIERNSGSTERSWHCYTLYLDGEVIFTSGEFWRAYGIVKAN